MDAQKIAMAEIAEAKEANARFGVLVFVCGLSLKNEPNFFLG
jgi:hypothetical protein